MNKESWKDHVKDSRLDFDHGLWIGDRAVPEYVIEYCIETMAKDHGYTGLAYAVTSMTTTRALCTYLSDEDYEASLAAKEKDPTHMHPVACTNEHYEQALKNASEKINASKVTLDGIHWNDFSVLPPVSDEGESHTWLRILVAKDRWIKARRVCIHGYNDIWDLCTEDGVYFKARSAWAHL